MPKEGISIYFTMVDGASSVLSSIRDKTKALDKETQQLAQATQALSKHNKDLLTTQTKLKNEISAANLKVKEAQKAYDEYQDELSKSRLDTAINEQADLKNQLTSVEAQLKANKKSYSEYVETIRKGGVSENSLSGGGLSETTLSNSLSVDTTLTSLAKGLAAGQVGQMLASSLGGLGEAVLTSAIGTPEASLISDTLSSTIAGAAMGSIIPGIGTAIGAGVGAISGLITGGTKIFEGKDDAFKEYYAGLYEGVNADTEDMIAGGSTIAGGREQTHKAFAKRLGGDEEADEYLERVKTMAAGTNYGYDEITGYSQLLLNSYDPDEVFAVLQSLSDATAGLNLSSSDVETMIKGLSRMRTTGKTTQEYLDYFSERGVDVYTALGDALGVDKSQIAGMVSKGDIKGDFAAQAILDYIDTQYGGLSEDLMNTYDAVTANLEDIMDTLAAAGGEGYNELRIEGKQADAEAYSGALGEAMEEINRIAGENKAYLENLSGQYQREALSAVLMGEETSIFSEEDKAKLDELREAFLTAQEAYDAGDQTAGLTIEALKEDAEALATAAYESSEQYQALHEVQMDQIEAIRENTAGLAAATNAYRLGQEMSKGSAIFEGITPKSNGLVDNTHYIYTPETPELSYSSGYFGGGDGLADANSHAFGLDRVPYDDYPALLHEGERVLTAAEARAEDAGTDGRIIQITVTGNNFVGTGEEMADQLAEIIVRKLENEAVIAVPR